VTFAMIWSPFNSPNFNSPNFNSPNSNYRVRVRDRVRDRVRRIEIRRIEKEPMISCSSCSSSSSTYQNTNRYRLTQYVRYAKHKRGVLKDRKANGNYS